MRNYLKKNLDNKNILIILIVFTAIFVRFYNFQDRVTFGPEQAISLETSARMIKEKFSLLGIENVQRNTSQGLKIFSGAAFSYSLIPLLLIFNYQALPLSGYFSFLNVFTGAVLYLVVKKILGKKVAIFSMIIFLFNNYMVYHSLFIWILDYLPLIGVLTFYLLYKEKTNFNYKQIFWLGILSGLGMSLEYLYVPTYLLVLILTIILSKKKIKTSLIFIASSVIPNLPLIIFDLKHDFYHFRVLWFYLNDVLNKPEISGIAYYDFLQFWPIFAVILAIIIVRLWNNSKFLALLAVSTYIFLNMCSSLVLFDSPTGMPKDLTISNIKDAAKAISNDNPTDFNVAVINDFDTRGHVLRYTLEFNNHIVPNAVEDYPSSNILYVLAPLGYNFPEASVWEIKSFNLAKVDKLVKVGEGFGLYKLTK